MKNGLTPPPRGRPRGSKNIKSQTTAGSGATKIRFKNITSNGNVHQSTRSPAASTSPAFNNTTVATGDTKLNNNLTSNSQCAVPETDLGQTIGFDITSGYQSMDFANFGHNVQYDTDHESIITSHPWHDIFATPEEVFDDQNHTGVGERCIQWSIADPSNFQDMTTQPTAPIPTFDETASCSKESGPQKARDQTATHMRCSGQDAEVVPSDNHDAPRQVNQSDQALSGSDSHEAHSALADILRARAEADRFETQELQKVEHQLAEVTKQRTLTRRRYRQLTHLLHSTNSRRKSIKRTHEMMRRQLLLKKQQLCESIDPESADSETKSEQSN